MAIEKINEGESGLIVAEKLYANTMATALVQWSADDAGATHPTVRIDGGLMYIVKPDKTATSTRPWQDTANWDRLKVLTPNVSMISDVIGYNAQYQADKLKNLSVTFHPPVKNMDGSPKYKNIEFYIIQLGWFESQKKFLFGGVVVLDGEVSDYLNFSQIGDKVLTSIPTVNQKYEAPIRSWTGDNYGEISFIYDWENVAGDTSNKILNIAPANYLTGHIKVEGVLEQWNPYLSNLQNILNIKGVYNYGLTYDESVDLMTLGRIVAVYNESLPKAGILKNITFKGNKAGIYTFGIGHLDQRRWYIETLQFNVTVTAAGLNTVDIAHLGLEIPKGDQLFIYTGRNADETILYKEYGGGPFSKQLMYGPIGSEINPLPITHEGGIYLAYDVIDLDTMFANKQELDTAKTNIDTANNTANMALNGNGKIKDRLGNTYRMLLNDPAAGEIVYIPMQFESVLIIGNSTTIHPTYTGIGWHANTRGMAATTTLTDTAAILQTALRKIDGKEAATVTRLSAADNGQPWEQTLNSDISTFETIFDSVKFNDYDLIVFRLSENVTDLSNTNMLKFKNSIKAMFNYLRNKWPNAENLITSDVMDNNALKNAVLSSAASEMGITYVDAGANDWVYKHVASNWDYAPYFYKGDDNNYHIVQNIFHTHPNDLGLLKVANAILEGIDYNKEEIAHAVNVNTSKSVKFQPLGVYKGIVTVLGYSGNPTSAIVRDVDGADIPYAIRAMGEAIDYKGAPPGVKPLWAVTFEMPNKAVNITV